jgi:hypothetical protein
MDTEEKSDQQRPVAHTYQDDLAMAMDTTDATVVQELLTTARERESLLKDEAVKEKQRGWYVAGSIILLLIALAAGAYGVWYYLNLTVPVQKTISVGVFPSTAVVNTKTTDIRQVLASVMSDTTLPENRPTLISLVSDDKTVTLLSTKEFFSFTESTPSEPLISSLSTIRLGVVHISGDIIPFVIASVPDPEVASKEFLIAEPELLRYFYRALNLDISSHLSEIGKEFKSDYLYNLPVRVLSAPTSETGEANPVLLYGYVTDNIIVVTTKPLVLKSIYETISRQR